MGSVRARPHRVLDLRLAYKKGFTGSKVERLPKLLGVKRNDEALVTSARVRVHSTLSAFGECARYVWGPAETSAEMLGIDPAPIVKPGYYFGATFSAVDGTHRAGVTVTRKNSRAMTASSNTSS